MIFQATVPIFEGGMRFADLKAKRAKIMAATLQKKQLKTEIEGEIRSYHLALKRDRDALEIQRAAARVAKTAFEQAQTLYGLGKLSQMDLIKTSEDLQQSQLAEQMSRIQLEVSHFNFFLATGTLVDKLQKMGLLESL